MIKRILLIIAMLPGIACAAQQNLNYTSASKWGHEGKKIHENFTDLYTNKAATSCFGSSAAWASCFPDLPLIGSNLSLSDIKTYIIDSTDAVTGAEIKSLCPKVVTSVDYVIGTESANECACGHIFVTSPATITGCDVGISTGYTIETVGNVAVSLDMKTTSDRMRLDGTLLDFGDKATNRSTSGDLITCEGQGANLLSCYSGSMHTTEKHWSDGN